jgi:hypothetical protein
MPVLTADQARELNGLLLSAFDKRTLIGIVRFSLGVRLDVIVNLDQGLEGIVLALLTWAERRGPSTIGLHPVWMTSS